MTENEIKDFFIVTEKNKSSYLKVREQFTTEEIENSPENLIVELLKQTFGFPISYFDEGKEDNFTLTEESSLQVYKDFAFDIVDGEYEDLYDFAQDFAACLPEV